MTFAELSTVLWRERELLELLVFKLEEEQLLLAAGRNEWIPRAAREVEVVLERIGEAELVRASIVDEVARSVGLPANPSLNQLATRAVEPWKGLLHEHRNAFLQLTERVASVTQVNKELLSQAKITADRLMASLETGNQPMTYVPSGARESVGRRSMLLDEEA